MAGQVELSEAGSPVTPRRIMEMAWGFAPPLMLEAAIKVGVFDALDAGGKSVAQVSADTGASARGLRALMDALVSLGFLATQGADEGRAYTLTPESSAFLVSTKPSFQGGLLRHASTQLIPRWLGIVEAVRTGEPVKAVNDQKPGSEFFAEFVEAIYPMSYPGAQALAAELGVAGTTRDLRVLDLAAGSGVWGFALASASPRVRVTAVDWAGVIPVTRRVAERHGLAGRVDYVEGDLATADFGRGHDVATLGHILHSEGEVRSRELLRKTFAALAPGGSIAIAEFTPDDDRTGPPGALIFGVNMLVNTREGDVFTFAQVSRWLSEAGFVNPRQLPAPGPSPLILATKP